ncbi:hypothetical protein EB241_18360 [Erwinia psidii]|uniref:Uncharacterized protein n=1 Tax=Erwinia psidii TaxID=69224 RepID=A0A3N6SE69_9GAMM|nr:hypothetical protein EB241_18360 [Erwinia psidii]
MQSVRDIIVPLPTDKVRFWKLNGSVAVPTQGLLCGTHRLNGNNVKKTYFWGGVKNIYTAPDCVNDATSVVASRLKAFGFNIYILVFNSLHVVTDIMFGTEIKADGMR